MRAGRAALVLAVLMAGTAAARLVRDYRFLINRSTSLPNWAFLVEAGALPQRGEVLFFRVGQNPLITRHFGAHPPLLGKLAYGLPGDRVERRGRAVFIHAASGAPPRSAGMLKPVSRLGETLAPGPTGIIPPRCFYAGTPNPDGLDSRYGAIGFVCAPAIFGTAKASVL